MVKWHVVPKLLLAASAAISGIACLALAPPIRETFARLDVPLSAAVLVGAWKTAGAVALFVPRPRLHEWVHAGFTFNVSGAIIVHVAAGDALAQVVPLIGLLALTVASYTCARPRPATAPAAMAGEHEAPA